MSRLVPSSPATPSSPSASPASSCRSSRAGPSWRGPDHPLPHAPWPAASSTGRGTATPRPPHDRPRRALVTDKTRACASARPPVPADRPVNPGATSAPRPRPPGPRCLVPGRLRAPQDQHRRPLVRGRRQAARGVLGPRRPGVADRSLLVAEVDGTPAGFLHGRSRAPTSPIPPSEIGHVSLVWVEPALRGRGAAQAMIAAAEAWFASAGGVGPAQLPAGQPRAAGTWPALGSRCFGCMRGSGCEPTFPARLGSGRGWAGREETVACSQTTKWLLGSFGQTSIRLDPDPGAAKPRHAPPHAAPCRDRKRGSARQARGSCKRLIWLRISQAGSFRFRGSGSFGSLLAQQRPMSFSFMTLASRCPLRPSRKGARP